MESGLASALDPRLHGSSGPIGVALGPNTTRLSSELIEAVLAGAAELGRDACVVRPGDDQARLGTLLGVGDPDSFLPVFAGPRDCRRVIWVSEPLLLRDEPAGGPLAHAARSRLMDRLRSPLRPLRDAPLPRPLARLRASATVEHQRARHVRELAWLTRVVDRVVVTSRDRRAALLEYGLNADAVPFGYAATTAGPMTPPAVGTRDLDFTSRRLLRSTPPSDRGQVGNCRPYDWWGRPELCRHTVTAPADPSHERSV